MMAATPATAPPFYETQHPIPKSKPVRAGTANTRATWLGFRLILAAKREGFPIKLICNYLDALDQEPQHCAEDRRLGERVPIKFDPDDVFERILGHSTDDWEELDEEDRQVGDLSLREGFGLLLASTDRSGPKFRVITEADRPSTTVLLPTTTRRAIRPAASM